MRFVNSRFCILFLGACASFAACSSGGSPLAPIAGGSAGAPATASPATPAATAAPSAQPAPASTPTTGATSPASPGVGGSPTPAATSPTSAAPATATPVPVTPVPATPMPSASPSTAPPAASSALWALVGGTIAEFKTSEISGGTVSPIHQFSVADMGYDEYDGLVFDTSGDLWIAEANPGNDDAGRVVEFTSAQLATLATVPNPSPAIALTTPGDADGLAFDRNGNLWVSLFTSAAGGSLARYSRAQYTAGGAPTPTVVLGQAPNPTSIAFGGDGTLWYTPRTVFGPSSGVMYGLTLTQQAASGSPNPAYFLQAPGDSTQGGQETITSPPNALAFDPSGNLWSIYYGYVYGFAASALETAQPAPFAGFQVYTQSNPGGTTSVATGSALTFDAASNLILDRLSSTPSPDTLDAFAPSQYDSGTGTPATAHFAASIPAASGAAYGDALTLGPYVP